MSRLREWASRVWGALQPDRLDRELEEELRQHLEFAAEDARRRGHLSDDNARAIRVREGDVAQAMEAVRAQRGIPAVESALRDVRYGLRQLRRSPAFTTAAVATLALAIAATTTMFSILDAVLFRPLPYESPEQLAMLWTEYPSQNIREGRSALWDVEQWRTQSRTFAALATFDRTWRTLTRADGAERIAGVSASANLFSVVGIQPMLGRSFSREEVEDGRRLVLISHHLWQSHFGGGGDALGASVVLDAVPYEVIGVLPPGFQVAGFEADVWEPHHSRPSGRGGEVWFVLGRLRPEVNVAQAQAEMTAIARRLDYTPSADGIRSIGVVSLSQYVVGPRSRLALWMLAGAVFCVFLIAAANVTSLSLARSVNRRQEIAVRNALGAGTGRIVRQLLTESVLLASVSGFLGLGIAWACIVGLRNFGVANLPRLNEMSIDSRAVAWAAAASLLVAVLVGLPSAITSVRRNLRQAGVQGIRGVMGNVASSRIRRSLVVGEFALAIVLLVGAGLFIRSWWNVTTLDSGFRPERVLSLRLTTPTALQAATSSEAISVLSRRVDLYRQVLEQIRAAPGVERAGFASNLFIDNDRVRLVTIDREGQIVAQRLQFASGEISDQFFETMGTPLRHGRFFSSVDGPDAPRVAIVNETMARQGWPGRDPIGMRFKLGSPDSDGPWYFVVGIVADMRRQGPEREPFPQMFVPFTQSPPQAVDLLVRTSSADPMTSAHAVREAVRRISNDAPMSGVAPLEQQLGTYVAQRRFQTSLLIGFSIAAVLMAAIGIYGLIQYSVATRIPEMGLRIALGAQTGDLFRMIVGEGLSLSLTGIAIGLTGAWWLGRASASLLFGVTGSDPLTFAGVSVLLTVVAIAACCLPARRAMNVEPTRALRAS